MSNTFQVELPTELRSAIAELAASNREAESEWIAQAVRERLAALEQLRALRTRAARGSRAAYERILAKVPAVPPLPGDER